MENMNIFKKSTSNGTCTKHSMARLRAILNESLPEETAIEEVVDETGVKPSDEKYARYDSAFNPKACSSRKDDDESYEGDEPGMSIGNEVLNVREADMIIANTGINPLMFEDGVDTEARMNTLRLHEHANGLKHVDVPTQKELDDFDKPAVEAPAKPHYTLMEVKKVDSVSGKQSENVRKFYYNGTEGYETTELNMDCSWYSEDEDDYKNKEKLHHQELSQRAVRILYKKLSESRKYMKRAFNNKKYALGYDFKKEFEYCAKMVDKLKEADEKIKQSQLKKRKLKLYDAYIDLVNLGSTMTEEELAKMVHEKSLAYAEKVIESNLSKLKAGQR